MKRWDVEHCALDECDSGMKRSPSGEYVLWEDAEALRLRAEKAEAERAQLAARLAEIERGAWGWLDADYEQTSPSFGEWFDGAQHSTCWNDGATVEWVVAGRLRTERYRIRRHVDDDGCVSYTYEQEAP